MDRSHLMVTSLLVVHIAAGTLALFAAPGAMLVAKGGQWHRRLGRAFVWAMGVVATTAIALATVRPNLFLALVAVFSFYLAFTGQRTITRRRLPPGERARAIDWGGVIVAGAGAIGLFVWALVPRAGGRPGLWLVALVFGVVGFLIAGRELRDLRHPATDPRAWWYRHMGNMLGAYIATVSAFSVVNFTAVPSLVRWLWPTAVGVPLILLWTRHYRRRFAKPLVRASNAARAT